MQSRIFALLLLGTSLWIQPLIAQIQAFTNEDASFALPTFTQKPNGAAVLYWSEKDSQNKISLYFAESLDQGKTFTDKRLIYADPGIGIGRLARPKLLFKKNGDIVAVFSWRAVAPAAPAPKPAMEAGHANHGQPAPAARPKRESQIRYSVSKDNGASWSAPASVDSDTSRLIRGFFDAVVLPNDEIAVAYLKDVKGSTKHEERDLRLVLSKNGVFQPEKLIDPVVCDCCNISLLVGKDGKFNIFYRDNNNDIRDIARLVSSDNGQTFGQSEILHPDKWEIHGCPHSGAVSVPTQNGAYISWYSGSKDNPGVRVVNAKGDLIKILDDAAQNPSLASDGSKAVWVWEQGPAAEPGVKQLAYGVLKGDKLELKSNLHNSDFGANPSVLLLNGKTLIAHEVLKAGAKTAMQVLVVDL
jgi:hypothetical protein